MCACAVVASLQLIGGSAGVPFRFVHARALFDEGHLSIEHRHWMHHPAPANQEGLIFRNSEKARVKVKVSVTRGTVAFVLLEKGIHKISMQKSANMPNILPYYGKNSWEAQNISKQVISALKSGECEILNVFYPSKLPHFIKAPKAFVCTWL